MRHAKLILTFVLFLAVGLAFSQADFSRLELSGVKPEAIYADLYGNIYAIQDFQFTKFGADGRFICSYGDFKLGHITSADVTNPQKIMLFYKESGTILFLDEHLAPTTAPADLFKANFLRISAAAYSTSNIIWLYDESNSDLIRTDFQLNQKDIIHQQTRNINPLQLFEIQEKTVVLNAGRDGLFFFDSFGTLIKNLPIATENSVQIINDKIFYLKDNQLHEYDSKMLDEKVYDIGKGNIRQLLITQGNIIILTQNGECFSASLHSFQNN